MDDDVKVDAGNVEEGVTEEPTPEPAPEPAPIPDHPVAPSNDDGRITALEGLVATLADTVAKLIPTDEPVREHKIPWTHIGGR